MIAEDLSTYGVGAVDWGLIGILVGLGGVGAWLSGYLQPMTQTTERDESRGLLLMSAGLWVAGVIGLQLWMLFDPCVIARATYVLGCSRNGVINTGGHSLVDEDIIFWWNPACNSEMP